MSVILGLLGGFLVGYLVGEWDGYRRGIWDWITRYKSPGGKA